MTDAFRDIVRVYCYKPCYNNDIIDTHYYHDITVRRKSIEVSITYVSSEVILAIISFFINHVYLLSINGAFRSSHNAPTRVPELTRA